MLFLFKKHLPNLEIWPKYSPFFSFWLRSKVPKTKTQNAEKDILDLWLSIEDLLFSDVVSISSHKHGSGLFMDFV
jgi:hypothetical protein